MQEGPNPIIFRSGSHRKRISSREKAKLVDGDIIELIPGHYLFKFVKVENQHASLETESSNLRKGKRPCDEEASVFKKILKTDAGDSFSSSLLVRY